MESQKLNEHLKELLKSFVITDIIRPFEMQKGDQITITIKGYNKDDRTQI